MATWLLSPGCVLCPRQREVVYYAFAAAWEIVKPIETKDTLAVDRARLRLAEIILAMEETPWHDPVRIRNEAVQRFICETSDV